MNFPRSRGGDPYTDPRGEIDRTFSPHARG